MVEAWAASTVPRQWLCIGDSTKSLQGSGPRVTNCAAALITDTYTAPAAPTCTRVLPRGAPLLAGGLQGWGEKRKRAVAGSERRIWHESGGGVIERRRPVDTRGCWIEQTGSRVTLYNRGKLLDVAGFAN